MNSFRTWIFRVLTLAGAAAMLYAWFQPWWVAHIEALQEDGVIIRPYEMVISGTLRGYPEWIVGAEMPSWFFPLMWVYLGVCLWCLFYSMFTSEEDRIRIGKINLSVPSALIGFAGLAFVIFVTVFVITVSVRSADFYGVQVQGSVFISMNEHTESYVNTSLRMGYWIGCAIGPFLLALAILRSKIVGKSELTTAVPATA